MAERAVKFSFLAEDRASKTFDKLAGKSDSLGSKMAGLGKTIAVSAGGVAAGGIAGLGAAFVQGVKDAASFEVLAKKTAAVIKSTGNVSNISVGGVQKLAASLESLSGVDEELIVNSQNVLATFTNIRNVGKNRIFDQATKSALDMSVALGTDLQGATIQIGKALNNPIKGVTALQRVGVSFTDAQKKQIKTMVESGHTMDAQKLILRELNVEFGGAAKAAGSTFQGSIARAKDAVGDFFRDLGTDLLPTLTKLSDWIATTGVMGMRALVSAFKDGDVTSDGFVGAMERIGVVARTIVGGMRALISAFKEGDVTSDGFVGAMERIGVVARRVFDFMKNTGIPALKDTAGFIVRNRDVIIPLVAALGTAVGVYKTVIAVTKMWRAAQLLLNIALTLNPIGLVIAAVAGMAAGLVIAWKKSQTFREVVTTVFSAAGQVSLGFAKIGIKAVRTVAESWLALASTIINVMAKIPGPQQDMFKKLKAGFDGFRADTKRAFDAAEGKINKWTINLAKMPKVVKLQGNIKDLDQKIKQAVKEIKDVPKSKRTEFQGRIDDLKRKRAQAQAELNKLQNKVVNVVLNSSMSKTAIAILAQNSVSLSREHMNRQASGGILPGPPSSRDNMTIHAASGEFVVNARSTQKHRALLEAVNSDRLPGFAFGGVVGGFRSGMNAAATNIARKGGNLLSKEMLEFFGDAGGGLVNYRSGRGVEQWRSVALQALRIAGSPLSWIGSLLRRMNQESGGNPRAVNLRDINAQRGYPSVGLMQVIRGTYRAYRHPLFSRASFAYGVSMDPLSNILASIRYANARYGSAPVGWNRRGGYRLGTDFVPFDGMYQLHRGEAVIPAERNRGGGGQTVNLTVNVNAGVGDPKAIGREVVNVVGRYLNAGGTLPPKWRTG